jgi:hypothetical protein
MLDPLLDVPAKLGVDLSWVTRVNPRVEGREEHFLPRQNHPRREKEREKGEGGDESEVGSLSHTYRGYALLLGG